MRPGKDEYYLNIAREVSKRATCFRVKIGAVIVRDDQIVATGYVGAPRKTKDCFERGYCLRDHLRIPHGKNYELCRSVHAEQNAIINAARAGVSVLGGTIFIYGENQNGEKLDSFPCFICKKMIINAGLENVVCSTKEGEIKEFQVKDWIDDWRERDILDDRDQYGGSLNQDEDDTKKLILKIDKQKFSIYEKNFYSGKFIVMEGLDGSGQSTQAELLRKFLREKGAKVILTKEPTRDSQVAKEIRKILEKKKRVTSRQFQLLFAKDRKEHLEKTIIPALKEGKIVISDRYFFSSFAYGVASGLDLDWLIKINEKFLLPDLTFFLKVRPEICLERIKKRGKERTLFEEKEKLEKVYKNYQKIVKKFPNVKIINGEKSPKEVFKEIKKTYEKYRQNN